MSIDLARELVLSHGWNSTSYQILNPGIEHWFSSVAPAVIGYQRRYRTLLVAGAPVCATGVLREVCDEFEAHARRLRCQVCYVCAEERLRLLLAQSPHHAAVTLGAQPVWAPAGWPDLVQSRPSLRAQLNRCRNKRVCIELISAEEAAHRPEIRTILSEWLAGRALPPMHFLTEPDVLTEGPSERVVFVARRNGTAIAYLVACPIRARNGYLVELLARSLAAPNGTGELLIDAAMSHFANSGVSRATLGLVALARAAEDGISRNPWWLRAAMRFARLHANRFYNFRGLEQFRTKLAPGCWEPVYAISSERHFSPRTLCAIGAAFSGISPWLAIGIGAAKALRKEFVDATAHSRRHP